MLNLIRAVYGIDHFSYIITSYCNSYKVRCCQDVMKYLSQLRVNDSQVMASCYSYSSLLLIQCQQFYVEAKL